MNIKEIDMMDLRRYNNREGLILQGCGGDLKEWVDGINGLFTEEGILLDGTTFKPEDIAVFTDEDDHPCMLFEFTDDTKLAIGKLAMWRLQTHHSFGGTWLSDYVDNRLGGFLPEHGQKPDCPLIGQDGNIFNLMGIASNTLRENGMRDQAAEMCSRIHATAGSYEEALGIIGEYVNITGVDDMNEDWGNLHYE